jgi:hypothetical protein
MPIHRPQSRAAGACGRRTPCVAAVTTQATPTPLPGTRRDPGAMRPLPVGRLHPASMSVLSGDRGRKRRGTMTL